MNTEDLIDYFNAAKFTSKENLMTLLAVTMTLFFHLVFTMALHFLPE